MKKLYEAPSLEKVEFRFEDIMSYDELETLPQPSGTIPPLETIPDVEEEV